jgi:prepilin-type N-terminal cleavage/methylation domain-containing protein
MRRINAIMTMTALQASRHKESSFRLGQGGGFSLVELLVTIVIISILGALLIPALSSAKTKARAVSCLSNLKQVGLAFTSYAVDHEDAILPNRDGVNIPLGETWVEGWEGNTGPDCTNVLYLQRSLIGPYLKATGVWRCPSAGSSGLAANVREPIRTISLNCFMGSPNNVPGVVAYKHLGDINRPSPSEALIFVDERSDTINDGSFAMQWDFDINQPNAWSLRDKPAVVHNGGAILTYADAHAGLHRWQDSRTRSAPRNDSVMPGNRDVLWLQAHGTRREQ